MLYNAGDQILLSYQCMSFRNFLGYLTSVIELCNLKLKCCYLNMFSLVETKISCHGKAGDHSAQGQQTSSAHRFSLRGI